jgi:hypothetical protein
MLRLAVKGNEKLRVAASDTIFDDDEAYETVRVPKLGWAEVTAKYPREFA